MYNVFIDGSAGTTGLRIHERLSGRADINLLTLPEERRKDPQARAEMFGRADIAFLCLPDDAARDAVMMIDQRGYDLTVLDTSTAHRTAPGWTYGFPELSPEFENRIRLSKRIAVPGCHASGFIALVYPLVEVGVLEKSAMLTCHSLTGYSGGGKKMIAGYEDTGRSNLLDAPRQYGLTQNHKHLREMTGICGLTSSPLFCPIVADFYSGMEVTVPIFKSMLNGAGIDDIKRIYGEKYRTDIVSFCGSADEEGFLSAGALSGRDGMQITVCGNEERMLLIARYDNLGKGASGAAIECLNIVIGADPTLGLDL